MKEWVEYLPEVNSDSMWGSRTVPLPVAATLPSLAELLWHAGAAEEHAARGLSGTVKNGSGESGL